MLGSCSMAGTLGCRNVVASRQLHPRPDWQLYPLLLLAPKHPSLHTYTQIPLPKTPLPPQSKQTHQFYRPPQVLPGPARRPGFRHALVRPRRWLLACAPVARPSDLPAARPRACLEGVPLFERMCMPDCGLPQSTPHPQRLACHRHLDAGRYLLGAARLLHPGGLLALFALRASGAWRRPGASSLLCTHSAAHARDSARTAKNTHETNSTAVHHCQRRCHGPCCGGLWLGQVVGRRALKRPLAAVRTPLLLAPCCRPPPHAIIAHCFTHGKATTARRQVGWLQHLPLYEDVDGLHRGWLLGSGSDWARRRPLQEVQLGCRAAGFPTPWASKPSCHDGMHLLASGFCSPAWLGTAGSSLPILCNPVRFLPNTNPTQRHHTQNKNEGHLLDRRPPARRHLLGPAVLGHPRRGAALPRRLPALRVPAARVHLRHLLRGHLLHHGEVSSPASCWLRRACFARAAVLLSAAALRIKP